MYGEEYLEWEKSLEASGWSKLYHKAQEMVEEYYYPEVGKGQVLYHPIYEPDPVVATNIVRLRKRSEEGIAKYKTTMMRDDLTTEQWIDHAIEEALDFANYLERLKRKLREEKETSSVG